MSSSKIIKSGRDDVNVCSVTYGGLADQESEDSCPVLEFFPLKFNESSGSRRRDPKPVADAAPQAPQALDPGMMLIAEAELQQKVEEALQKGIDEGRQQTERGLANVFRSLREGIDAITRLREKVLRSSEEDLLKLAIMVARKVIQQEIKHDPQILANIIAETLSSCSDLDRITIRLNPDDCSRVSANRHFYLLGIGANTQVSLIPDEAILPGGCMVDTVTGTIDARIEVQLEEIYRRFLETRGIPDEASGASEEMLP